MGNGTDVGRRLVRALELTADEAVEVLKVEADSPASRAGLIKGDIIVAMNDKPVRSVDDLHRCLTEWQPGETVRVSFLRGKTRSTVEIQPVETVG